MAHVDLRHCVERLQYRVAAEKIGGEPLEILVGIGASLWQAGYADDQESDADRWGVLYAARAGYSPHAILHLFSRMQMMHGGVTPKPESIPGELGDAVESAVSGYFRSHPTDAERIDRIQRAIAEQRLDTGEPLYVGAQNLARRTPHSELELEDEWLQSGAESE
jgi:predicted Zn-dependent protease